MELKETLDSLANQSLLPEVTYLVDNNCLDQDSEYVRYLAEIFSNQINTIYVKSAINSGAIARQLGVERVLTPYTMFLDSDVELNSDYAITLINALEEDYSLLGAQGVDYFLQQSYINSRKSLFNYIPNVVFEFLGVSTSYTRGRTPLKVLPSLCIQNPANVHDFNVKSEWLSTCAGIFRTFLFDKYSFDMKFIKYSWNEYLLLSKTISLETSQFFLFTSSASYKSILTDDGRLSNIPLMYMAESYDFYIFFKLFKPSLYNLSSFALSRIGRLIYYLLRALRRSPLSPKVYFACFHSVFYPLLNQKSIQEGNFTSLHSTFIDT